MKLGSKYLSDIKDSTPVLASLNKSTEAIMIKNQFLLPKNPTQEHTSELKIGPQYKDSTPDCLQASLITKKRRLTSECNVAPSEVHVLVEGPASKSGINEADGGIQCQQCTCATPAPRHDKYGSSFFEETKKATASSFFNKERQFLSSYPWMATLAKNWKPLTPCSLTDTSRFCY